MYQDALAWNCEGTGMHWNSTDTQWDGTGKLVWNQLFWDVLE